MKFHETIEFEVALQTAKDKRNQAIYLSYSEINAGLTSVYNKNFWLFHTLISGIKSFEEENEELKNKLEKSVELKYFEIHSPYYALIRAENLEKAKEKYITIVCEEDEEEPLIFAEVSKDYALVKFVLASVGREETVEEILDNFNDSSSCNGDIVLIDGEFI